MHFILRPLIAIATLGLGLSLLVHLAALLGLLSPLGEKSWMLAVGIFVVWFPAVLILQPLTKDFKQKDLWRAALRGCPVWMRRLVWVLAGYAMVNFAMFAYRTMGAKTESGPPPDEVWTGHSMVFYGMALAIFHSALRIREHDSQRRCLAGHPASPSAQFCDQCGQPIREV